MLALIGITSVAKTAAASANAQRLSKHLRTAEGAAELALITAVTAGAAAAEAKSILRK
jgi:hypothetical protein